MMKKTVIMFFSFLGIISYGFSNEDKFKAEMCKFVMMI